VDHVSGPMLFENSPGRLHVQKIGVLGGQKDPLFVGPFVFLDDGLDSLADKTAATGNHDNLHVDRICQFFTNKK
jgi:hypothetical protein